MCGDLAVRFKRSAVIVEPILLNMIATRQETLSADQLYLEARGLWVKAVKRCIYDSEDIICRVMDLLERARQQNPRHVRALVLLSDLLMQLGAADEAMEVVSLLLRLQPNNKTHRRKKALLQQLQSKHGRDCQDEIREFIEVRWMTTNDW